MKLFKPQLRSLDRDQLFKLQLRSLDRDDFAPNKKHPHGFCSRQVFAGTQIQHFGSAWLMVAGCAQ